MTKPKRKLLWGITFFFFAVVIIYFLTTQHIYRAVSWDGHGETDVDGSPVGVGSTDWKCLEGRRIYEARWHYSSSENAKNALEKILETSGMILERKKYPDSLSGIEERVLTVLGNPEAETASVRLIKLQKNEIYLWDAFSLKDVRDFERAWVKLGW